MAVQGALAADAVSSRAVVAIASAVITTALATHHWQMASITNSSR
jgi:hypothetical protein